MRLGWITGPNAWKENALSAGALWRANVVKPETEPKKDAWCVDDTRTSRSKCRLTITPSHHSSMRTVAAKLASAITSVTAYVAP